MGRYAFLFFFFFLLLNILSAQSPQIDILFREDMIAQKAQHYQQMLLCEQQQTANQQDYDATYYSLDLTLDPTTSTLEGTVKVVAEVTSPTLSQIELNFWGGLTITKIYQSDIPEIELGSEVSLLFITYILYPIYFLLIYIKI